MGVLVDGRLDVSQQRAWEHSREGEVGFVHPMESVRHFRAPHATTIILILISGRQVSIQEQKSPLGQCLPQDGGDWERCRGVLRCVLQPQGCGCLTHPPQDPVSPFSKQSLPHAHGFCQERRARDLHPGLHLGFQGSTTAVQATRAEHSTVEEVNAIPPRLRAQMCTSGTHGTPSLHLTSPQNCGAHCPPHLSSITDVQGTCTDGDASSLDDWKWREKAAPPARSSTLSCVHNTCKLSLQR